MKKTLLLFFFLMLFKDNIAQVSTQEEIVYDFVQQPPKFPGGQEALIKFIAQNLTNIKSSSDKYIAPTKIIVQFIVMKDSSLRDINVIRGGSPEIDSAVSQLFQKMPKWIPAEQNGYLVNARFILPLNIEYDVEEIEQPEPPSIPEELMIDIDKRVYTVLEQLPSFNGGVEQLNNYIVNNLKCPDLKKDGTMILRFIVMKDSSIKDISVIKEISKECSLATIDMVQNMPKWIPGKQNNIDVNALCQLKIAFISTQDSSNNQRFAELSIDGFRFPGGLTSMYKFINENLLYPAYVFESGKEQEVVVRFNILKNGKLSAIRIHKSTCVICNKYAIDVVTKMPNWLSTKEPNTQGEITITFKVDEATKFLKTTNHQIIYE
ncbi:MAG: energy transducer TonB [Chitinophagales bacterium]|nr:energy transducer TonB [Chitinophagales bacterium]